MHALLHRPHCILVPGVNMVFKEIRVEFDDSFHASFLHFQTRKI